MEILIIRIIFIVSMLGLFTCLILGGVAAYQEAKKRKTFTSAEAKAVQHRARVVDQICGIRYEGMKSPKLIKDFFIVFETEDHEKIQLNVPEEFYPAFEKGQNGLLTLVNGELYSFEIDEE